MEPLSVDFHPKSLAEAAGADVEVLRERVRALIRRRHPSPPHEDPHDGPAIEGATIRALERTADRGWRIEFGYLRDSHSGSRYDKSETADGELVLAQDGSVVRARLGLLRRG